MHNKCYSRRSDAQIRFTHTTEASSSTERAEAQELHCSFMQTTSSFLTFSMPSNHTHFHLGQDMANILLTTELVPASPPLPSLVIMLLLKTDISAQVVLLEELKFNKQAHKTYFIRVKYLGQNGGIYYVTLMAFIIKSFLIGQRKYILSQMFPGIFKTDNN